MVPRTLKGLVVLHTSGYWQHYKKAVAYTYDGHSVDGTQTVGTLRLLDENGDEINWLPAEVVAGVAQAWHFAETFPKGLTV